MTDDPSGIEDAAAVARDTKSLEELRQVADGCVACDLHQRATQVVFGEGNVSARIMILGEQPGDQEDREGHPFVGPAGSVLDSAMAEAGISHGSVYITNIVKHFRWKPGAKKRLHQKPATRHVRACRPWLEAEIDHVGPEVIVALGASASQTLLGVDVRVTRDHGQIFEWEGVKVIPTVHPSAVLRAPESGERRRLRRLLVSDLRTALEESAD